MSFISSLDCIHSTKFCPFMSLHDCDNNEGSKVHEIELIGLGSVSSRKIGLVTLGVNNDVLTPFFGMVKLVGFLFPVLQLSTVERTS